MPTALPKVVIVGRPNVGKSTLFNRLAGGRIAVVLDKPGITRDRLYVECELAGSRFTLIDTGGILFDADDPLIEQVRNQAMVAMAEADVVLFVVDVEDGVHPADLDLAKELRGFPKSLLVVVNKVDNEARLAQALEFYSMGIGEVFSISSIHGHGMAALGRRLSELLPRVAQQEDLETELRLAIVGRPNVGKSSLLNALTGDERSIVSEIPGTTRDAIDTQVRYKNQLIRLVDTAGIRRPGKIQGSVEYYMVLRAQRALQRADCAIIVLDSVEGLTDGDMRVARAAQELGRAFVFVANKWDLVEPPDGDLGHTTKAKKNFIKELRQQLPGMPYIPIRFSSALAATGMEGVMNAALMAVENWRMRIPTGPLNRLVRDAAEEKPLNRKGKQLRVRYVTQPEICPPTIVLFVNDKELVHFSYSRYLENEIRKKFPLEGTPIRLVARDGNRDFAKPPGKSREAQEIDW